jgi:addiction module HigA family antidote
MISGFHLRTGLKHYLAKEKDNTVFGSTSSGESVLNGKTETHITLKLLIIIEVKKMKKIAPVHPGEILNEEFLKPLDISQNKLGRDLGVSPRRINEIVHGKRRVTADTALRLSTYFGNSASFWLGLQMDYDLDLAEDTLSPRIHKEVRQLAVA